MEFSPTNSYYCLPTAAGDASGSSWANANTLDAMLGTLGISNKQGSVVYVGGGTHTLTVKRAIGYGVRVVGTGIQSTIIKEVPVLDGDGKVTNDCGLTMYYGSSLERVTVQVDTTTYHPANALNAQFPICVGAYTQGNPGGNGVLIDTVEILGVTDGIWINAWTAAAFMNVTIRNCSIRTCYDALYIDGPNVHVTVDRCRIACTDNAYMDSSCSVSPVRVRPTTSTQLGGSLIMTNCVLEAKSTLADGGNGVPAYGVVAGNGAVVLLDNVSIKTSTVHATCLDIWQATTDAKILASNCIYDAAKTSGTILASPHLAAIAAKTDNLPANPAGKSKIYPEMS